MKFQRRIMKFQRRIMKFQRRIKWWLYKFGVRPKLGSIWYSPSLDWMYSFNDEWKKGKA